MNSTRGGEKCAAGLKVRLSDLVYELVRLEDHRVDLEPFEIVRYLQEAENVRLEIRQTRPGAKSERLRLVLAASPIQGLSGWGFADGTKRTITGAQAPLESNRVTIEPKSAVSTQ